MIPKDYYPPNCDSSGVRKNVRMCHKYGFTKLQPHGTTGSVQYRYILTTPNGSRIICVFYLNNYTWAKQKDYWSTGWATIKIGTHEFTTTCAQLARDFR